MSAIGSYVRRINGFSWNAKMWLLSCLFVGFGAAFQNVLFPLYIVRLGHNESLIGSISSIASATMGLCALPVGLALRNKRRRVPLFLSVAISAAITALQAAFPVPALLLLSNVLYGALQTIVVVSESPYIMENSTPEERSHLFSVNFVAIFATFILGGMAAGPMPRAFSTMLGVAADSPVGYRYALMVGALVRFASAAPLLYMRESVPAPKVAGGVTAPPWKQVLSLPSGRVVAKLCLTRVFWSLGCGLFQPFVQTLLKVKLSASTEAVGVFTSITNVGITIGSLSAPMLERVFGMTTAISWSMVLAAPFLVLAGASGTLPVAAGALVVRDTVSMATGPLRQRFSMEMVTAEERPVVASLDQVSWQLPWALGSWFGGRLIASYGYEVVFGLAGALFLVTAAGYSFLFRAETAALKARRQAGIDL